MDQLGRWVGAFFVFGSHQWPPAEEGSAVGVPPECRGADRNARAEQHDLHDAPEQSEPPDDGPLVESMVEPGLRARAAFWVGNLRRLERKGKPRLKQINKSL